MLLIDISNVMHRCNHALEELCTTAGIPTGMEYGTLKALEGYVKRYPDQELVVCFDKYRKENRPDGYKGGRSVKPNSFYRRMEKLTAIIKAGYQYAEVDDTEADAVIYALSLYNGEHIIISSDKDLYQCLREDGRENNVVMHSEFRGKIKEWTAAAVWHKFKVHPYQWSVFRSFIGDPSDNLPGCKGLGPQMAAEITRASFHIEDEDWAPMRARLTIFSDEYFPWMSDRLQETVTEFFAANTMGVTFCNQFNVNYGLINFQPLDIEVQPKTGGDIVNYLNTLEITNVDETEF